LNVVEKKSEETGEQNRYSVGSELDVLTNANRRRGDSRCRAPDLTKVGISSCRKKEGIERSRGLSKEIDWKIKRPLQALQERERC